MAFVVIRRAWPRGRRDVYARPFHTETVSTSPTQQEATDRAARLAAAYRYHRYDAEQGCWVAYNEEGPVFTFTVESEPKRRGS